MNAATLANVEMMAVTARIQPMVLKLAVELSKVLSDINDISEGQAPSEVIPTPLHTH